MSRTLFLDDAEAQWLANMIDRVPLSSPDNIRMVLDFLTRLPEPTSLPVSVGRSTPPAQSAPSGTGGGFSLVAHTARAMDMVAGLDTRLPKLDRP